MEEEITQILIKTKSIEKSQIEEIEQKLEMLCGSKPTSHQGKCLMMNPANIDFRNILSRGVLVFLDTDLSVQYNKVFSLGPQIRADFETGQDEFFTSVDSYLFKGDPSTLYLSKQSNF